LIASEPKVQPGEDKIRRLRVALAPRQLH